MNISKFIQYCSFDPMVQHTCHAPEQMQKTNPNQQQKYSLCFEIIYDIMMEDIARKRRNCHIYWESIPANAARYFEHGQFDDFTS